LITPAYAQAAAQGKSTKSSSFKVGVDLLTDTNGISVDAYMRTLISNLKERWIPLMTGESQPLNSQEETVIDFTIARDGQISAMRMEDSTHDVALDKAAWSATKATPYSPPPAGMREPNLKLRVHFTVN
jgi:TonB family protein